MLIVLFGFSLSAYSQKIKLVEGDLSALKGLTGIKTEFSYDNMSVGKFPKEADYVSKKKNAKSKGNRVVVTSGKSPGSMIVRKDTSPVSRPIQQVFRDFNCVGRFARHTDFQNSQDRARI